ncbi:hypothetical protein BKA64DRAFT_750953 [Cadophora sp. MPI-SDFR-AT-0126]|nr:hypothetical protein BKA64DRAFT_750953 [Leotiomycetes sp. MPI-SDFR-AT-0126]
MSSLARQTDSSESGLSTLLNDSSNYPSFPPTDIPPSSTSTETSISFSVLGNALVQDLTCRNCSAQGDISLQGVSDSSSGEDSSGWSLVAAANGVSAHVEIEANLRPDTEVGSTITLTEIELDSFEIGGLVVVTSKIVVELTTSFEATVEVDISWGFDVTVPDGASIMIAIDGGEGLSLPISATISNPEISPVIGLRFNFLLAVSPISSFLPSIYAGVYMDLPGLIAQFSPVSNVNAKCQNITSEEADAAPEVAFPNLLYIQPVAFAGVGATLGTDVSGDGFEFNEVDLKETLASVELQLPNQCLEWSTSSEGGGTFGEPDVEALTGGDSDTATSSATGTMKAGSAPTSGPGVAKTSSSSPNRTSGAAAESSSNGAVSNRLQISVEERTRWVVGMLTLGFMIVGFIL